MYGAPSSGYGTPIGAPLSNAPVGAPSSGYGAPSGAPLNNAPGGAPSSGYGSNTGAQNSPLAPPPPYQGPIMKAPRGPMPQTDSNNVIQGNSYGNLLINGKNKHVILGTIMAIRVVEFSNGWYKIRKIFA